MDGIVLLGDNINKIVEVTEERKEREKVTEAQLEISRLNLQAAQTQKEAKLIEAYNNLLVRDTSHMSEEAKASQEKILHPRNYLVQMMKHEISVGQKLFDTCCFLSIINN